MSLLVRLFLLSNKMRVFERQKSGYDRLLPFSPQSLWNSSEVLQTLQQHVRADGSVRTLFLEFENWKIPVQKQEELGLVAQLASAYNNALVADRNKCQRDLYGHAYAPTAKNMLLYKNEKAEDHALATQSCSHTAWDEEVLGDRFVFDSCYEQNQDLLPWRLKANEERFGFYE